MRRGQGWGSVAEGVEHGAEAGEVAGGDAVCGVGLDLAQGDDHRTGGVAAGAGESDEKGATVGLVERSSDEAATLEAVEDAAQRGGAVIEAALKVADGVGRGVGEEGEDMCLALGDPDARELGFETDADGVRRSLQVEDEEAVVCVGASGGGAGHECGV
jgi:hypothetical protein